MGTLALGLDVTQLGGAVIVRVSGRLTRPGTGPLTATIERLLCGRPAAVVVDLHDLSGLDRAGVAAFVHLSHLARTVGTALRIIGNDTTVLSTLLHSASPGEIDVWDTSGRLSSGTSAGPAETGG